MTLTDIKDKITGQLAKLTIDDFYSSGGNSFARQYFFEITKLKTDEDIQKYLSDKFPETTVETLRFPIEQAIAKLRKEIVDIESMIAPTQKKIDKLDADIDMKNGEIKAIPVRVKQKRAELTEIESEITQIKPLSGKPPYDKQMVGLEKQKQKKEKELEDYSTITSNLKSEHGKLLASRKTEREVIAQKKSEIKVLESSIESKQQELNPIKEREKIFFTNEYSSLEFLFKIFLGLEISKQELTKLVHKETGQLWTEYLQQFDKWEQERKRIKEIPIEVKTGEVKLVVYSYRPDKKSAIELESSFTNSKSIIPKDWRNEIDELLSNPLPQISGTISRNMYLTRESLELSDIDTSTLLATKIAIRSKHSIKTADNRIVLALSGGIAANISFREKGALISKFQVKPIEVFANCLTTDRHILKTLYYQTGYANSDINIYLPKGYYILTDKYVVEISFVSAPILFDNNSVIKFAPNISGNAKMDDYNDD